VRASRGLLWLPVAMGGLVGGLVAGRLETALACVAVVVVCGIVLRAGWPPRGFAATLLPGMALAFLLNLYLNPGTALGGPRLFGLIPTHEGARYGSLLALRMLAACVGAWVLARGVPAEPALDALAAALRPLGFLGIRTEWARSSLGLALRLAPLVRAESARIARVQALRAGGPARGVRERLRRARAVWVPTMVCSLERAERTALALEARRYSSRAATAAAGIPAAAWLAGAALATWALLWRA
jgi:energy-coupling factor transporter transmembrane protein EcfT